MGLGGGFLWSTGSAMPTASTGLRTSRPVQSLAVKASLSAERPTFGTALIQAASTVGTGLSALALSALLNLGPGVAISDASEFNVLSDGPPTENYVVDDANVLNRVTRSDLKRLLRDLEERKGYHINVITLRKLTSKADSFEFADTVRLSVLNHSCCSWGYMFVFILQNSHINVKCWKYQRDV